MKPILIVISTCNRLDLTGVSLDSVRRNKSSCSDVVILDDASTDYDEKWLGRWGFGVIRSSDRIGVGLAAQRRYTEFIKRGYSYLCALDNDVLLARHFDLKMLELFCTANDSKLTVASGYYSSTKPVFAPRDGSHAYWQTTTINGISQFTDTATAAKVLDVMEGKWKHPWDDNISKELSRIAVPKRSLVQHIGIHGSGVNGTSNDVAVDFVGDGCEA
jgi:hypothetical protein